LWNFPPNEFPPMFDMGESLEEIEDDIFLAKKKLNREITF
jgi:hypothetical protein